MLELLIPALLPMQPVVHGPNMPNLIGDEDDDETIANVFCFGAFADKHSGVVYNNLTGAFPFMSLDGCMCIFVLYHYKLNAILVTPISGMDDVSIFNAYKNTYRQRPQTQQDKYQGQPSHQAHQKNPHRATM